MILMLGTKILEEKESKFNGHIKVVRSWGWGTYIQANGLTQSGGIVATFWKQTLRHIRYTNPDIRSVLILGLGGGTVVKSIKKFWPEAKITGVDIDPLMVELGKEYLGLDRLGVRTIIQDAGASVPGKFDLVIVDLYRGDKFPTKFESDKFLKSLTKNRTVIFNRLYYKDKKIEALEFGKKLEKIFNNVETFRPVVNLIFICSG